MAKYQIHPQSIVETAAIGELTKIWAFVHILQGASIGKNNNICDHCFIENKVIIGNNVTIKSGVYIWDGATIEDDVFVGPAVVFTNDRYPRSKNVNYNQQSILLKKGSSIGANATLLPGITVGRYAMVGAGSVVTKNVDDYTLVVGNPARKQGNVCSCGKILTFIKNVSLCECKLQYQMINNRIVLQK